LLTNSDTSNPFQYGGLNLSELISPHLSEAPLRQHALMRTHEWNGYEKDAITAEWLSWIVTLFQSNLDGF
jgi:hypothetical protein